MDLRPNFAHNVNGMKWISVRQFSRRRKNRLFGLHNSIIQHQNLTCRSRNKITVSHASEIHQVCSLVLSMGHLASPKRLPLVQGRVESLCWHELFAFELWGTSWDCLRLYTFRRLGMVLLLQRSQWKWKDSQLSVNTSLDVTDLPNTCSQSACSELLIFRF